jgi:DNA-binding YbaB/EbfC family protein
MAKKKRSGRGYVPPRQPSGMSNLAQQIQKMQEQMIREQEALSNETLEVTAGGGMVTIVITGDQRVESITLKPEVVDPDDMDMLQDLLVAAVNQAIEQSQAMAAERLEGLTGGLNLPGLPGLG